MSRERYQVKFAVYLFLRRDNKILLLKRHNTGYMDGTYSLVSGHVEKGEPAELAMVREAKEEAGIDIDANDLHLVYVTHRLTEVENDDYVDFYFEVDKWRGEPVNAEPEKCSEIRWAPVDALPKEMMPYVKEVFEKYSKGGNYASMRKEI